MKELSIEEKAKAYDKALERVKDFIEKQNPPAFDRDLIGTIFPELKESEDEKTERILHSISSKMSLHLCDIFTEEEFQYFDTLSYAWLEKQGQVKESVISQHENKMCKENDDSLTSEEERIREAFIDFFNGADGEQLFSMLHEAGYEWDVEKKELKKIEQNPSWSEEDEEISKGILNCLCLHDACELEGFDDWYEWLKNIKYRVQSKQEWNKEDERMRQYVVSDLRLLKKLVHDPNYAINVQLIEKEIEWMESLKGRAQPQNRWKPSENDIDLLERIRSGDKNYNDRTLYRLIKNLKKLREEDV